MKLSDFKVLTFDCYGTLIDWNTGISASLTPWIEREKIAVTMNEVLAAHGRHEAALQAELPRMRYSALLAEVMKRLGAEFAAQVTDEDALAHGHSIREWPAFPDSADALRYLQRHFRLVVLSNVDCESFTHSNARLGVTFDRVFTAEEIGSYKPDLANFRYMLAKLGDDGVQPHEVLHVAESLFHDHVPAQRLGLRSCWIRRQHDKEGYGATHPPEEDARYDFHFRSLGELADAHRNELQRT